VGGTPIMDVLGKWPLNELTTLVEAAKQRRQPVVFVGSGVEGLKNEESRKLMTKTINPAVKHWTVRSDRDRQRLMEYGVATERVTVAADLAWTLTPVSDDFGSSKLRQLGVNTDDYLVGVNLTNEQFVSDEAPELFQTVAEFLDLLIEERNAKVLFFSNEVREDISFDKAAALRTQALMKHGRSVVLIPNDYWSPQEALTLIGCCDLTISMRYHFCLFSALQRVPFIALKRSDKVDDLCWDMNWHFSTSLSDVNPTTLLEMVSTIKDDQESVIDFLTRQVCKMAARSAKNRAALDALISER
jgi:polysaccharide pyruvyl transferase WcaK-like protein